MRFELADVRQVVFTNTNTRVELHGEEHVRAIDIAMQIAGENTLLDLIEPGLREHHYCNGDLKEGQQPLPDVVIPLPHLRHPKLPQHIAYAKGEKWRGYRWVLDYGLDEKAIDLTDGVLAGVWYELQEGGTVTIGFTFQHNGQELNEDRLYGRLAALTAMGTGHVQVLAPPTLLPVKKGWRSGKADADQPTDGGAPLLEGDGADGGEGAGHDPTALPQGGEGFPEGSPEAALLDSVQTEQQGNAPPGWPFPLSAHDEKPKGRRGQRAAAGA